MDKEVHQAPVMFQVQAAVAAEPRLSLFFLMVQQLHNRLLRWQEVVPEAAVLEGYHLEVQEQTIMLQRLGLLAHWEKTVLITMAQVRVQALEAEVPTEVRAVLVTQETSEHLVAEPDQTRCPAVDLPKTDQV